VDFQDIVTEKNEACSLIYLLQNKMQK